MINRIILIGNGFDLAHEMPTSYNNFISNYWSKVDLHLLQSRDRHFSSSDFSITYTYNYIKHDIFDVAKNSNAFLTREYIENSRFEVSPKILQVNNNFLFQISEKSFQNWVDIENEYYDVLLGLVKDKNFRQGGIEQLNKDLTSIKNHLDNYLRDVENSFQHSEKIKEHIKRIIFEPFKLSDFSQESRSKILKEKWDKFETIAQSLDVDRDNVLSFQDPFDKLIYSKIKHGIWGEKEFYSLLQNHEEEFFSDDVEWPEIISFNYTSTEKLYLGKSNLDTIHIHGQLADDTNPLIFGYGDELDDAYPTIEKLQDNKYLDNMKSINYSKTSNYKRILSVLESGLFQIYVMGHSCGNSDRTLLNTIFEHDNCASIKIFFYEDSNDTDKYLETYKNISRNFNNKAKLRDRVVNWQLSEPLVPYQLKLEAIYELKNMVR